MERNYTRERLAVYEQRADNGFFRFDVVGRKPIGLQLGYSFTLSASSSDSDSSEVSETAITLDV
jgi:hypothetical protein